MQIGIADAVGIPNAELIFAQYYYTVEDQIAEGDRVVTRWTARVTHKGELPGIPPTGKQVCIAWITVVHAANGRMVEGWTNADMLGMMQQLGVVPKPGQAG